MPGEHTVIVGGLSDALKARHNGLHLRDTLTILLPEGHALTAFLFRQPLDGTVAQNVVEHGCGGLNIDRCRVAHVTVSGGSLDKNPHLREHIKKGKDIAPTSFKLQPHDMLAKAHSGGRWPTNLVFVHGPGCTRIGEKQVPGINKPGSIGGKRHNSTYAQDAYSKTYERTLRQCHASPDGTETVQSWDCQPDCPVRILDRMTEHLHGAWNKAPEVNHSQANRIYGRFEPERNNPNYHTNEGGGASRFFPQFATLPDALDWLDRLIGHDPVYPSPCTSPP